MPSAGGRLFSPSYKANSFVTDDRLARGSALGEVAQQPFAVVELADLLLPVDQLAHCGVWRSGVTHRRQTCARARRAFA